MVPLRPLVPLLAMVVGAAADAPAISNRATHTFSIDASGRKVAEVKLYVSDDDGASWAVAQELLVPDDSAQAPRLRWTAPHDGAFAFIISSAYADRQVDPAPRAGQEPAVRLIVDTRPPRIARFTATPASATAVALAWTVEDDHPGSARVECSDDGTSWSPLSALPSPNGEASAVAIPGEPRRTLSLRLVASDAAGNETTGDAVVVTFPDAAFASAVHDLPALDGAPADAAPATIVASAAEAAPTAVAAGTPGALTTSPVDAAPTPAAPATTAGGAPSAATTKAADVATPPAASAAEAPSAKGSSAATKTPVAAAKPAKPPKNAKKPVAAKPPAEERRPAYRMPAARLFIKGAEATAALARARAAAADDERAVEALDLYRQLRDSDRAKEAAPEELRLLAANGAADEAIRYATALPPELTSDATRLEHARLLHAAGRGDEAMAIAGSIARASPEADPATLVVAACLRDAGRVGDARRLYQHLVAASGAHAAEAAAELAALPEK